MPREISIFGAYVPAILLVFIGASVLTWGLDRLLALTGLYRFVWHPALFRVSLLACMCGGFSLVAFH